MLRFILFPVFLLVAVIAFGQDDSTVVPKVDTIPPDSTHPVITHHVPVHITHKDTSVVQPAQTIDTVSRTPVPTVDSLSKRPVFSPWKFDNQLSLSLQLLEHHSYYKFGAKPVVVHSDLKTFTGKEVMFYTLIGLLIAFSLLRQAFPKYFNDLFRLLFRTTLKQKQIREQLMQTPLPSLFLNIFFAVTGGLYIDMLLQHFDKAPIDNFWLLFLYCSMGLAIIYIVKFFGLKLTGWLFNIGPAADAYIFVVYIINKVIGVFLLPFLVLLAFTQGDGYTVAMLCSFCGIGVLFVYRFLLTYSSVRNQVRFNLFHFLLYLFAFEIAPLLLIYKALLFVFR